MKTVNIYNKVKAITMACAMAATAMMTTTSCSDWLEVKPQDLITEDNLWNEKTDVESVITGIYDGIASKNFLARAVVWGECRAENMTYKGTLRDNALERVLKEDINASNAYADWSIFYSVINRCNLFLEKAPQVAVNDPSYTQGQLQAHIAEVTAIRAICYFYLVRAFRDVPYVEQAYIDDTQQRDIPQTNGKEIISKLISSLQAVVPNATDNYPPTTDVARTYYNTGRITKTAIYALLADLCLWNQDYQQCCYYAQKVIDKKKEEVKDGDRTFNLNKTLGYPLIDDYYTTSGGKDYYGYAFSSIFASGNSKESIFEISFIKNDKNTQANGMASAFFGNLTESGMIKPTQYVQQDQEEKVYVVFTKKNNGLDSRGWLNFAGQNYCAKFVLDGFTIINNEIKKCPSGIPYDKIGSNNPNKANFILYRLSDVMLMKAEALTQMMSGAATLTERDQQLLDEAFELVDAVNRRSLMEENQSSTLAKTEYTTKEDITDLVYDERERELMFEGKRYFDLVRRAEREGNTQYLADHCSKKNEELSKAIANKLSKMDAIYWPVFLDEMKANPSLKQNGAFNSGESNSMKNSSN